MHDHDKHTIHNHVVDLGKKKISKIYFYKIFFGNFSYGRNDNGFIRDDHRINGSSRQSRNGYKPLTPTHNGKQAKSPRNKGQQKPRNPRQHKQRNQNSKTEGKKTKFI